MSFWWVHLSGSVSRQTLRADLASPSASEKLTHFWRLPFHSNHVFGNVCVSSASYTPMCEA
jgi:hypothetical protein